MQKPPGGASRSLSAWLACGSGGALLVAAAVGIQQSYGLLIRPGREPGVMHELLGFETGALGFLDLKDLFLFAVDLVFSLPGTLLLAAALAGPLARVGSSWWRRLASRPRATCVLLATATALTVGVLGQQIIGPGPVVDDEHSYLIQARIFLQGRATLPLAADPELFETALVLSDRERGIYASQYFFGWPLLLAPWVAMGVPRLAGAAAAGFLVLLGAALARALFPGRRSTPILVALLLTASPMLLLHAATLHSQVAAAALLTAAMLGAATSRGAAGAVLGGLIWGLALNTRPLSAVAVLPALVLVMTSSGRLRPRRALGAGLGAGLGVGAYLAYNAAVTGSPLLSPMTRLLGASPLGFYGFGHPALDHTPVRACVHVLTQLVRGASWIFGWPCSWLLLPALARRRPIRAELALMLWAGVHLVAYSLSYFGGVQITGPAYSFELIVPIALLTARAAEEVAGSAAPPAWRSFGRAALLLFSVYAVCSQLPSRVESLRQVAARARAPYRPLQELETLPDVVVCDFTPAASIGWRLGWDVVHPALVPPGQPLLVRSLSDSAPLLRWIERRGARFVSATFGVIPSGPA